MTTNSDRLQHPNADPSAFRFINKLLLNQCSRCYRWIGVQGSHSEPHSPAPRNVASRLTSAIEGTPEEMCSVGDFLSLTRSRHLTPDPVTHMCQMGYSARRRSLDLLVRCCASG
jgi:hypothetical protein